MSDRKRLLSKWIHRKRSVPVDPIPPQSTPPSTANPPAIVPEKFTSTAESVIDNLSLALGLAEQVVNIAQVAPFIAPAAALLSQILQAYKEAKDASEKRDILDAQAQVSNLTGDLCATVLRIEATNCPDLIGRLKLDLERYAALITKASDFVDKYDTQGKIVRWAARNQLGEEMDTLNQELNSFGARFRTNRLVDLAINQSANTEILNKIYDMAVKERLEKWLQSPPDMSQKQHDTEKLRKDGTGHWFLEGDRFIEWQDHAGFLWIEGPSGAGKSVLSSTKSRPPAVAFFYFDFRDKERQSVESALRRIVLQLSAQSPHSYRALDEQYKLSNGQKLPSYEDLQKILQQLLSELGRTYVVLDALDECDELSQIVDLISTLRHWTDSPLHLFITSQTRQIFTEGFRGVPCITLNFNVTQEDIKFFVKTEIQTNPKLKIWRPRVDDITDRVSHKSQGMFRLAACLLIELSRCKFKNQLDNKLKSLPDTLFEIYDRFLDAILPEDWVYVEAVLRWLMFSERPMYLEQLSDAIAFDFTESGEYIYDPSRREDTTTAISDWLEGLVTVYDSYSYRMVSLAHVSVQDYLLSTHFMTKFHRDLSESLSHTFIARSCIRYLLYFADHPLDEDSHQTYPLAGYAAIYWCHHLLRCPDQTLLCDGAMRLLEDGSHQYNAFTRLSNDAGYMVDSTLQFCCQLGFIEGVRALLANNADVNVVSQKSGTGALTLAAEQGHLDIVRLLVKNGANLNLQGNRGTALSAASGRGHVEIVHLLLDHGADINLQGEFGTPLEAASSKSRTDIVRFLLKHGADVKFYTEKNEPALAAASYWGNIEIVRLLLEHSADVNARGEKSGTPLEAASRKSRTDIVCLLLEHGADVKFYTEKNEPALAAASYRGSIEIVRLLLEHGADVNVRGEKSGTPLEAASSQGKTDIVRLLLEHGADVKFYTEKNGPALAAASYRGNIEIVRLLLEHGADVNVRGEKSGTPLEAASSQGKTDIVRLLLEHGADVKFYTEKNGPALAAASYRGSIEIVRLLLEHGADVNVRGEKSGTPLEAASSQGKTDIVRLLLEHGADVKFYTEKNGPALVAALYWGNIEIVRLLLEHGADVNVRGEKSGTPLEAASSKGKTDIVRLFLEHGADVKFYTEDKGPALACASYRGDIEIVRMLLEHGADVNLRGEKYGTPLEAAWRGEPDIVNTLSLYHIRCATEDIS
ncbi:ankyrin repeat-containing domain protein [Mycena olivaceomarginata]|nr:ankyrin repeat-containing domain protein [Mycena olivaceomarginata]